MANKLDASSVGHDVEKCWTKLRVIRIQEQRDGRRFRQKQILYDEVIQIIILPQQKAKFPRKIDRSRKAHDGTRKMHYGTRK